VERAGGGYDDLPHRGGDRVMAGGRFSPRKTRRSTRSAYFRCRTLGSAWEKWGRMESQSAEVPSMGSITALKKIVSDQTMKQFKGSQEPASVIGRKSERRR